MSNKGGKLLTSQILGGFKEYKYAGEDTSPLANYVMKPFWRSVQKITPVSVAPNTLTFAGLLFAASSCLVMYIFDYNYQNGIREVSEGKRVIPREVFLYAAIAQFLAHTLDGVDGIHARAIGRSSPLGELFDHGCDSLSATLQTFAVTSAIGLYKFSTYTHLLMQWAVLFAFYITHAEKYIRGSLFLPWTYDLSQIMVAVVHLIAYFYGVQIYQIPIVGPYSASEIFLIVALLGLASQIALTAYNVHVAPTLKRPLLMGMLSFVPCLLLFGLSLLWVEVHPEALSQHLMLFEMTIGFVFSNINSNLIVYTMSGNTFPMFNNTLAVFALATVLQLIFFGNPSVQNAILLGTFGSVVSLHLRYAILVVNDLCHYLDIKCF